MIVTVTLNPGLDRTLTVPEIRFNEVLRATSVRVDCGGKGFNVSRALAALGVPSVALGLVGGGAGETLASGLRDAGIESDLVRIAQESRTATVVREDGSSRHIKVNEPGPCVSAGELAVLRARVAARAAAGDLWTLCGSLPPGVPVEFYGELIGTLLTAGARPCLDTSGEPLRLGCQARPFLVKPNLTEAAQLLECEEEALAGREGDAVTHLLRLGIQMVALSLGAEGLILGTNERRVRARPPRVEARNAVGTGDALLAGLAWALERGLPLEEAARWGVAAGTASAMREGVTFGSLAEVGGKSRQVVVYDEP